VSATRTTLPLTAPSFDEEEVEAVRGCLRSGWVTQGPLVRRFEERFARAHGVPHALATTSCTAALHLATMALGLGPGDEVVVPAFTWVTSAHSVEYTGAKVVFCDIDLSTYNLDPASLRAAVTARTRAVIAVHLFGLAAPMNEVREIASARSIRVIEDAACAVGTAYAGAPVGGLGDVGCFSFHPRKVITTGEGGMVTTTDPELAAGIAALRNHGAIPDPAQPGVSAPPWKMGRFEVLGYNLRLSDIQAAVGLAQLAKMDDLLRERRHRARRYDEILAPLHGIALPVVPAPATHTFQTYVVRVMDGGVRRRNAIMEFLQSEGIHTRPGTHAVHRVGYYARRYGLAPDDFPCSAAAEDTTIAVPLFPGITDADQERVAASLAASLRVRVP
jgi:dTDP-4-amino-4,6-dideoxygalactose transaminase